jgi:hypothetical protein
VEIQIAQQFTQKFIPVSIRGITPPCCDSLHVKRARREIVGSRLQAFDVSSLSLGGRHRLSSDTPTAHRRPQ